ncbi:unnamed protein product [Lactuca virosa]|uniref:Mon2/Sec7/BIG1-like HDS domain-containing protein n=1 Tax=Lactuca virosa TaxID=75947 RepID=A0AAU9LQI0_9ASTR|nr:unnamed protein product [Lactuca virosa]
MTRIRMVWARIWSVLANHFIAAGSHHDEKIAIWSEIIQRLIVDCVVQMIKSKVESIIFGWRSVFMIFTTASDDDLEPIVKSAFENVE